MLLMAGTLSNVIQNDDESNYSSVDEGYYNRDCLEPYNQGVEQDNRNLVKK